MFLVTRSNFHVLWIFLRVGKEKCRPFSFIAPVLAAAHTDFVTVDDKMGITCACRRGLKGLKRDTNVWKGA